jgi:D-alanyl-D-alanine carboxypeptidase
VVPAELAPFKELFLRFGAQLEFSANQYTAFLADLAASAGGEPLSAQELDQALAVSQVNAFLPESVLTTTHTSRVHFLNVDRAKQQQQQQQHLHLKHEQRFSSERIMFCSCLGFSM